MNYPTHCYGITGYPLGHTLSPVLHNWGFARTGHPGVFLSWPQSPEHLPQFIAAVRVLPISGLCLTIPHKQAVLPLVDTLTPDAQAIGAVNTLYWRDGLLVGGNTDVIGFMGPLKERPCCSLALVLGAGGAARAVLAGLNRLKVPRVVLAARNLADAAPLARDFGCTLIPWEERAMPQRRAEEEGLWVINATPLGMSGHAEHESPYPAEALAREAALGPCLAYDLVYSPLCTRFLAEASERGWETQDGLDMLVGQGLAQFTLWTGKELPHPEARAVLLEALARRKSS